MPPAVPRARLLFVVNVGWFFLSHRLPLALAAQRAGYEVHVACGIDSPAEEQAIRAHGLIFHRLGMSRAGFSPWRELGVLRELLSLYRSLRPSVIHHVTIKPVLYGGLLCRLVFKGRVVSAISGLGYLFIARGTAAKGAQWLARAAYRGALSGSNTRVIFQNRDDLSSFVDSGLVPAGNAVLIRGAGVDLQEFRPGPEPAGPVTILLPARMLRDKGVLEFVEAAAILRRQGVDARFVLAGGIDRDNPQAISEPELSAITAAAGIQWLGHRQDMAAVLSGAHIVCLPSYREGLPKALLEAAASGKPIVSTDVPGCREAVVPEVTGLLVPARDAEALARALRRLIEDPELRARMGAEGRRRCVAEFGIDSVVQQTLALYES